ncbi:hypothetical protein RUM44_011787 [Polyplax serrata]|uniref:Uncharacterized protein n=1 Tax=Polyplax serrata TaxID=468196 RepID=A0ABR1AR11_POLSC
MNLKRPTAFIRLELTQSAVRFVRWRSESFVFSLPPPPPPLLLLLLLQVCTFQVRFGDERNEIGQCPLCVGSSAFLRFFPIEAFGKFKTDCVLLCRIAVTLGEYFQVEDFRMDKNGG